jgi:hypothetical protein
MERKTKNLKENSFLKYIHIFIDQIILFCIVLAGIYDYEREHSSDKIGENKNPTISKICTLPD